MAEGARRSSDPAALHKSTAERSIRRRKQLTCGLCSNVYRSPKLLPCLHTFCCRCLEKLVRTEAQFNQTIMCPNPQCGRTQPVPPGGAQGYPDNEYLDEDDLERARTTAESAPPAPEDVSCPRTSADRSDDNHKASRSSHTYEEETLPLRSVAFTSHGVRRSQSARAGSSPGLTNSFRPKPRLNTSHSASDFVPPPSSSVPPGGVRGGGAAAAAKQPTMCPKHKKWELEFCCLECEMAVCFMCSRVIHHQGHPVIDLPEAAEEYRKQLVQDYKRLVKHVDRMEKLSDLAQCNLKAARQKVDTLKEEVNAQHNLLVAMSRETRDKVLEGLDANMANIEPNLTLDVRRIQEALDCYVNLLQRVSHAIPGDSDDADAVSVAVEMKHRKGSPEEMDKIHGEEFKPRFTVRPGLHSYSRTLKESLESTIVRFFGSPVLLTMLNTETAQCVPPTSPVPFFRCGADASCREVHAICRTDDGQLYVTYGGKMPKYSEEEMVVISPQLGARAPAAKPYKGKNPEPVNIGRKITFDKSGRQSVPSATDQYHADDTQIIQASSNGNFLIRTRVVQYGFGRGPRRYCRKTIIESKKPEAAADSGTRTFSMEVGAASNPVAFDANANSDLFVIINEDKETVFLASGEANRGITDTVNTVRLYRKNRRDPIATYTPPTKDPQHSLPTAVSFWKHGMQDLLLIADWLDNSVHMVHVGSGDFRFLCYLTAGSGDLVRPTALDVDADKNIWIGCENGWVLKCPFRTETGAEDVDSLLSQILTIANPSFDDSTISSRASSSTVSNARYRMRFSDDGDAR